jgi:starch synthase
MMPSRQILMVASEAVPFAKTGGLGDVAGALPLALARLGHQVTLVLPRYRGAAGGTTIGRDSVALGGRTFDVGYVEHILADRARVVLVECAELFDRPELYGVGSVDYPDNAARFAVLARAALQLGAREPTRPDIVHAHDWQTGLAPVYLRTLFAGHPAMSRAASVFTIHNLAYQGLFPPVWMPAVDLGWDLFGIEGVEYWGKCSYLKGGINFSDMVTTVSPRYAREIQTPEFGFGFDGILKRRARRLRGILNGIDVEAWNPATDPNLPAPFGPDTLGAKSASKRALLEAMGLLAAGASLDRPVVGMVSRLIDQKGFDLVAALGEALLAIDATFVVLGSGEARYQEMWQSLSDRAPGRVAFRRGFDEPLAHLIEAGADIFLMPSKFEPCGLNQMYSLRYGTVPVVHAVGGLDDTIKDWNSRTGDGTGFKFRDYTPEALRAALLKALDLIRNREAWQAVQRAGMQTDFSWDASAAAYVKVYEAAIRARKSAGVGRE